MDGLAVCRWCGGRLRALIAGDPPDYCPYGCARNDLAPFLKQCAECERDFTTGRRYQVLCERCDRHEHAAMVASYREIDWSDSRRTRLQERLVVSGDVDE